MTKFKRAYVEQNEQQNELDMTYMKISLSAVVIIMMNIIFSVKEDYDLSVSLSIMIRIFCVFYMLANLFSVCFDRTERLREAFNFVMIALLSFFFSFFLKGLLFLSKNIEPK